MATAKRYEDLVCWQLAHELQQQVFAITATGPASRDRGFCDQIRDSARSSTRNMAEGFALYMPSEFRRFLRIAHGSLEETHNHLRDARDRGYLTVDEHERLARWAGRAAKATVRLMAYLRTCKRQ